MVTDVVESSAGTATVTLSESRRRAMNCLKDFLFQNVYLVDHPGLMEVRRAGEMLKDLFRYYMAHPEELPVQESARVEKRAVAVCDFVASMSDRYAQRAFRAIGPKAS